MAEIDEEMLREMEECNEAMVDAEIKREDEQQEQMEELLKLQRKEEEQRAHAAQEAEAARRKDEIQPENVVRVASGPIVAAARPGGRSGADGKTMGSDGDSKTFVRESKLAFFHWVFRRVFGSQERIDQALKPFESLFECQSGLQQDKARGDVTEKLKQTREELKKILTGLALENIKRFSSDSSHTDESLLHARKTAVQAFASTADCLAARLQRHDGKAGGGQRQHVAAAAGPSSAGDGVGAAKEGKNGERIPDQPPRISSVRGPSVGGPPENAAIAVGFPASSAEGKDPQSQPAEGSAERDQKRRSPSRLSAESKPFRPKASGPAPQNTAIPTVNKITIDSEYYSVAFPSKLSFFAAVAAGDFLERRAAEAGAQGKAMDVKSAVTDLAASKGTEAGAKTFGNDFLNLLCQHISERQLPDDFVTRARAAQSEEQALRWVNNPALPKNMLPLIRKLVDESNRWDRDDWKNPKRQIRAFCLAHIAFELKGTIRLYRTIAAYLGAKIAIYNETADKKAMVYGDKKWSRIVRLRRRAGGRPGEFELLVPLAGASRIDSFSSTKAVRFADADSGGPRPLPRTKPSFTRERSRYKTGKPTDEIQDMSARTHGAEQGLPLRPPEPPSRSSTTSIVGQNLRQKAPSTWTRQVHAGIIPPDHRLQLILTVHTPNSESKTAKTLVEPTLTVEMFCKMLESSGNWGNVSWYKWSLSTQAGVLERSCQMKDVPRSPDGCIHMTAQVC